MTAAEILLSTSALPSGTASEVAKARVVTVYGYNIDMEMNLENTIEVETEDNIILNVEKADIILQEEDIVITNEEEVEI